MNYHFIKNIILRLFKPNLKNKFFFMHLKDGLNIIDVGSTGGLDMRWDLIKEFINVYSFDPDSRSKNKETNRNKVFPFALWSKKEQLKLNLTKFPDASSVFILNDKFLESFLNYECHHIISSEEIKADSADNVEFDNNPIDFMKIDTEGAELEILKGSKKYLGNTIIGLELEVQFVERTIGSPLFSDIDNYLKPIGYQLMILSKQSWIRKNNLWNINSNPQLIWADAVYILNEENIINQVTKCNQDQRETFLLKFLAICLVYGFHDYSFSVMNRLKDQGIMVDKIEKYKQLLKSNVSSNIHLITLSFMRLIFSLILLICVIFLWSKRKSIFNFFKSSTASLFFSIYSLFSRSGPFNVAINDFIK